MFLATSCWYDAVVCFNPLWHEGEPIVGHPYYAISPPVIPQ